MHKHDEIFCTICKKTVPEDRVLRQAVTCSKECARTLKNLRRQKRDQKKCRYCAMPSTPEERQLFKAWRAQSSRAPKRGRPKKVKPEPAPQEKFTEMINVG
jgi:predicted nucleic acid-binding Zn ribbon protein